MVHIGSGEILKRIFLGSVMSQHTCVPGRTPIISHGTSGSAGLDEASLSLYSWYTHTLLPLMYIQAIHYLLQVSLLIITAQLQFNPFFKALVILSGDLVYGNIFNFPFFSKLTKLLRYFNRHRDFLLFGHILWSKRTCTLKLGYFPIKLHYAYFKDTSKLPTIYSCAVYKFEPNKLKQNHEPNKLKQIDQSLHSYTVELNDLI